MQAEALSRSRTALPRDGKRTPWLLGTAALALIVLAGCSSRTIRAPISDLSGSRTPATAATETASAGTKEAGARYVVQPGDTLYRIAQDHGMTVSDLMAANRIDDPSQLRVGQSLAVAGAAAATTTAATAAATTTASASASTGASSAVTSPVSVPGTGTPAQPAAAAEKAAGATSTAAAAAKSASPAAGATEIQWQWPYQGRVIRQFSSGGNGVDIEGNLGDAILAAADGKVMYVGNGLRGMGNLVLVWHNDDYITAYAHNQELLVKTGQQVRQGQQIATLGQSDTTSPRLHFEIRRSHLPVDPLTLLPAR